MNIRGKLGLGVMAKKKKVKNKGKFSLDQIASMFMEEVKKQMVKTGFATADQIAAAEIQMQKESEVQQNGEIDSGIGDRTPDVCKQGQD